MEHPTYNKMKESQPDLSHFA